MILPVVTFCVLQQMFQYSFATKIEIETTPTSHSTTNSVPTTPTTHVITQLPSESASSSRDEQSTRITSTSHPDTATVCINTDPPGENPKIDNIMDKKDELLKEFMKAVKKPAPRAIGVRRIKDGSIASIFTTFNCPSKCSMAGIRLHEAQLLMSKILKKHFPDLQLSPKTLSEIVTHLVSLSNFNFGMEQCEETIQCDTLNKFRTIDGTCNNLKSPNFGAAGSELKRLVPAIYEDGFNAQRLTSASGRKLPDVRHVSIISTKIDNQRNRKFTSMLMQWGQYLDHDLSLTPMEFEDVSGIDCSDCDSAESLDSSCWPIKIPEKDPFFPRFNKQGKPRCFHFVRSAAGKSFIRQQLNEITSHIDASNVYGSSHEKADMLRAFKEGHLKTYSLPENPDIELLPVDVNDISCRADKTAEKYCFFAGDTRVNEHPALTAVHTAFIRSHNFVAKKLLKLNPKWNDERIYQETRRIEGAVHQIIAYNEFLPAVLGPATMAQYDLNLLNDGFSQNYDESCETSVSNIFATAAFRMHSLIQDMFVVITNTLDESTEKHTIQREIFNLVDIFMNPSAIFQPGYVTGFLVGLLHDPAAIFDGVFAKTVKQNLFETPKVNFSGEDLIALNLQRGRDHGLPSYPWYRKFCNLSVPSSFENLKEYVLPDVVEQLSKIYESVDDIDPFIGLVSEIPIADAAVGPTTACIIGEQFGRSRKCDRFFHDLGGQSGSFTADQLYELRKITLGHIICGTQDSSAYLPGFLQVRRNSMLIDSPWIQCSKLAEVSFEPWKEK